MRNLRNWRDGKQVQLLIAITIAVMALASCGLPYQLVGEWPPQGQFGGFLPNIPANYRGLSNPFTTSDQAALAAGNVQYHATLQPCALCHGENGRGDGPNALYVECIPADFAAPLMQDAFRNHPDYVYWWVSDGVAHTEMPAYKDLLTPTEIWQAITYAQHLGQQALPPSLPPNPARPSSGFPSVPAASPTTTSSPAVSPSPSATAVVGNAPVGQQLFTSKGCAGCHIQGAAPKPSVLATLSPSQFTSIVRIGRDGMPAYSASVLSNGDLADIMAWVKTQ